MTKLCYALFKVIKMKEILVERIDLQLVLKLKMPPSLQQFRKFHEKLRM